ncbi:MAG: trigger factor [Ruminococcaceae bacterium]|nr:trigger factor [Oscillospiraceae bacterium]
MSFQNIKDIETNKKECQLLLKADVLEAETKKVYKKNAAKIAIPGFRKGKAPRNIIEKMYGKGIFEEEAIDNILPELYSAAADEADFTIVSKPEVDIVSRDDEGIIFKFTFYVKPEVTVKEYKGLKAKKEVAEATDEDVNNEIENVRKRNSRTITVEGEAQNGDIAVIDYKGFVDGVAFEGGEDKGHNLTLGSGSFIPGFEDQLIGKKAGDEVDVKVTFPEDYHAVDLAGKEAVFNVKVNEVKRNELPELDDEFVKDVSEFSTLDEYKADIKAKIQTRKEHDAELAFEGALYDLLIENLEGEIPDCMFENEIDGILRDYEYNLKYQGIDFETYLKYTGQTMEQVRASVKPRAEKGIKRTLALEYIAKAENIVPTAEDYEEEFKKLAAEYSMKVEEVKEKLPEDAITEQLSLKKAFDFVKENAIAE